MALTPLKNATFERDIVISPLLNDAVVNAEGEVMVAVAMSSSFTTTVTLGGNSPDVGYKVPAQTRVFL